MTLRYFLAKGADLDALEALLPALKNRSADWRAYVMCTSMHGTRRPIEPPCRVHLAEAEAEVALIEAAPELIRLARIGDGQ